MEKKREMFINKRKCIFCRRLFLIRFKNNKGLGKTTSTKLNMKLKICLDAFEIILITRIKAQKMMKFTIKCFKDFKN